MLLIHSYSNYFKSLTTVREFKNTKSLTTVRVFYFLNFLSEYCPNWYAIKIGISANPIYFSIISNSIKIIRIIADIIIKIMSNILLFIVLFFVCLINANGLVYEINEKHSEFSSIVKVAKFATF